MRDVLCRVLRLARPLSPRQRDRRLWHRRRGMQRVLREQCGVHHGQVRRAADGVRCDDVRRLLRRERHLPSGHDERGLRHCRGCLRKLHARRPELQRARLVLRVHSFMQPDDVSHRVLRSKRRMSRRKDRRRLRCVGADVLELHQPRGGLRAVGLLLQGRALRTGYLCRMLLARRHVPARNRSAELRCVRFRLRKLHVAGSDLSSRRVRRSWRDVSRAVRWV